jgi:hypothetical protein
VQLVHACHRWGFSTVVPSSWGDELLAAEVIKRCASRENRPAIQCSCPRVAERLGANAAKIDDSVFWLTTPPVAAAHYIRAHSPGSDVHVIYAGSCPGAIDASIDQRMTPAELLMAIGARGIDIGAQPTVFENIIPPDRRRHFSERGGVPDAQRLWETAAFRVMQPSDIDLSIGVAQLLLSEDRLLIDMTAQVGCVCRMEPAVTDPMAILRSPSPIVREGVVDVSRSAPVPHAHVPESRQPLVDVPPPEEPVSETAAEPAPAAEPPGIAEPVIPARRNTPGRPFIRRQGAWRRHTPRSPVSIAQVSPLSIAPPESKGFFKRSDVRVAIAMALAVGSLMMGIWMGRRELPSRSIDSVISSRPLQSRSP